jgi:HSP20 family protein
MRFFGDDVFRQMQQMRRDAERIRSAFDQGVYPAINIYDDSESFIVRAELPGVQSDDIDIQVTGKTLNIKGNRKIEPVEERFSYHRRERNWGDFRRAVDLPEPVDSEKVMANFNNGVLEVLLPRAEQAKQRKIEVKAR